MVNYRRNLVEGASYFFTVNLKNRNLKLLTDYIDRLRTSFKKCHSRYPFKIDAIVILPEHLHTIWTLPKEDSDYPKRWKFIKSSFTHQIQKVGVVSKNNRFGEHGVWQRRYWEHTIRNEREFEVYVDYIHYNPVKHGLVKNIQDWPYSSFYQYVKNGVLHENWGIVSEVFDFNFSFGEAV